MRCRNVLILLATFVVLCLSPLADIHFEANSDEESYVHGQEHSETIFELFIHELLFTHLQHTFDHVTLGISPQTAKKSKQLTFKGVAFSYCVQPASVSIAVRSSPFRFLNKNKRTSGVYFQELSGLSPPIIPS